MTGFLRNNRYASVILTTIILVGVAVGVGFTRDTTPNDPGFVLRADEQAVHPSTSSVPSAVAAPLTPATLPTRSPIALDGGGRPARPRQNPVARGSGAPGAPERGASTTAPASVPSTTRPSPGSGFEGNRVAFSAAGRLWTINADGTDPRAVADSGYAAAWSPDRATIAYADADLPGGRLYLVSAAGAYLLTTGVAQDSEPTWSPDGSKLAFARIDTGSADGYSGIWVINRDGSGLRRVVITPGCFNRDPAWSPDGTKIAFWSSGQDHCSADAEQGSYELYTLSLVSDEVQRLGTATNSGAPAWSPDGRSIAFSSDGYGGRGLEVCVMAADGSGVQRVTNSEGDDTAPSWSPDGKRIAFQSDRDGGGIYTMSPNGTGLEVLVAGGRQPSWR